MKVLSLFTKITFYLRYFFYFKKINPLHFDFIDIVLEKKSLLLLSWEFADPYYLRIKELNKSSTSKNGAIILKVPTHINKIKIIISTTWRKKTINIDLKKVTLTKEVSELLIQQLNPLIIPEIMLKAFQITNDLKPVITIPIVNYKNNSFQVKLKNIVLNSENIIYPQKD